jgi:hypothetical protein
MGAGVSGELAPLRLAELRRPIGAKWPGVIRGWRSGNANPIEKLKGSSGGGHYSVFAAEWYTYLRPDLCRPGRLHDPTRSQPRGSPFPCKLGSGTANLRTTRRLHKRKAGVVL